MMMKWKNKGNFMEKKNMLLILAPFPDADNKAEQ